MNFTRQELLSMIASNPLVNFGSNDPDEAIHDICVGCGEAEDARSLLDGIYRAMIGEKEFKDEWEVYPPEFSDDFEYWWNDLWD